MALSRQSTLSKQTAAVFDQTIDELQTYVGPGKPVGSMNLEEFLHTFWDKGGQMHNSWDREHEFRVPADVCSPSGARESAPQTTPLQSVPEDLRGMSVEEVWQHISERNSGAMRSTEAAPEDQPSHSQQNGSGASSHNLGRVTVSNFLQSVGMELTPQQQGSSPRSQAPEADPSSGYGRVPRPVPMQPLPNPPQLQVRVPHNQGSRTASHEGSHAGSQRHRSPQPSTPETPQRRKAHSPAPDLPVPYPGLPAHMHAHQQDKLTRQNGSIGAPDTPAADDMEEPMIGRTARQRKRKDIDVVDERSDRMAKRMVKNRESAARSRQRKQQYTYDLEAQVENLKLQNRQLLEKVIRACAPPPPRILPTVEGEPLRRTRSGNL